jgi:V/A-type H+-transporting ATPase subunit K
METLFTLPLILAMLGLVTMLALPCVGSAIGVSLAANALIGGMKKNPDMFGKGLVLCAIPTTQGLYAFAAFFLFLMKLAGMTELTMMQGTLTFAAGVAVGLAGYFSCLYQVKIACNGLVEISNGRDVFGQTLILAVFPELYAILTFAASFLVWIFAL